MFSAFATLALGGALALLVASPQALETPSALTSPTSAPSATPVPPPQQVDVAATPRHGFPKIFAVWISTQEPRAGDVVSGRVQTSENVHYVEARVNQYNQPLKEDAPGRFSLSYRVPWWLPFWLRHEWTLQVIARSVDGVEAKTAMPIRVR